MVESELSLDVANSALARATLACSVRLSAAKASCINEGLLAASFPLVGLMIKREMPDRRCGPEHGPAPGA